MMKKYKRETLINFFWFLGCILISLVIWLYVAGQETDDIEQTIRGISVAPNGEDILRNKNLVILDWDTNTVDITVKGPRREIGRLNSENIKAVVDVSKFTRTGSASPSYSIVFPTNVDTSNIYVSRKHPEVVSFSVSEIVSKTIPVRGSFDGSVADGYVAGSPVYTPSSITVSGPDSYINNIEYAWVSFSSDNISSTYIEEVPIQLQSEDGSKITVKENISVDFDIIEASLPIYLVKSVPLKINPIYGAGATEDNCIVSISPEAVVLVGESTVLDSLPYISLGSIDFTSFQSDYNETFPIVYDASLKNQSGVTEANVSVKIVGLDSAIFTVENFAVTNVTEGFVADVLSEKLEGVVIRSSKSDISEIKPENIRAVVDLKDYVASEGKFMVPVKIIVNGASDAGAIGYYEVSVEISKA